MKKYSWIVALLLALSLAFIACPSDGGKDKDDDDDDDDVVMVDKVVFELATDEGIQALTVADTNLVFGEGISGAQPIKPLIRAGENDTHVTVKAVAGPGEQKVSLEFTAVANWGAGLDLLSKEFGFQVGDKITLKGEVLKIGIGGSKPQFQANGQIGGEYTLSKSDGEKASIETAEAFDWEITLDAAAMDKIKLGKGGTPEGPWPGIRLAGNGAGTKVRLDNIKIEGKRPEALKTLAAPVIELTETGVKWTAVEGAGGYLVLVGTATEAAPTATLGATATSYNIKADKTIADGSHKVKVIATGETGVSKNSAASNEVTYVKDTSDIPTHGPQSDGSYLLDPTAWESWYGASLVGDTISFSGGGMYYLYPDDPEFDIASYGSLVINFTAVVTKDSTLDGKDGEAAVSLKLVTDQFTGILGSGSNYGQDIDYKNLTKHFSGGVDQTWTITDSSDASKQFATAGFVGFAIAQNNGDTNAEFDVTFHSIIFYPAE